MRADDGLIVVSRCVSGLSLDHQIVSSVSRVRLSEREEESLSCYLKACDASLSYLQELDKVHFYTCSIYLCVCPALFHYIFILVLLFSKTDI